MDGRKLQTDDVRRDQGGVRREKELKGEVETMLGGYIGGENLDAFIAELDERFAKTSDLKIEKISGLQEALDEKQAEITGGASSVVSANLSSEKVLISDTAGKIAVSTITLQNLKALWERYNRLPAGVIFPWGGKIANKPSWSLFCDGSEVSRTQFADLFDAIGTTWGEGDGSTTFNLPDFVHGGDNGNLGRFLRAATHDEQQDEDDESYVGALQADAIRDITGIADNIRESNQSSPAEPSGAFYRAWPTGWPNSKISYGADIWTGALGFSASRVVPTAAENRPIAICTTVLIAY